MRSQLLQQEEQGYDQYKSVKVKITGEIFMGNTRADEPIFKKKDLNYDKHQLAKLISFEHLELLMRFFKNDPAFKNCIFWQKAYITSLILFVLFMFAIPLLDKFLVDEDPIVIISWEVMTTISAFVFFLATFRILFVLGNAKKALKAYCESLDLTLEHLTIRAVLITGISNPTKWFRTVGKAPGKYNLFCDDFSHFQIKSSRILNDETTIKLYNRGTALQRSSKKMEGPIIQQKEFEYNKAHLEKIISFADLQSMLHPFKSKESYKKSITYTRAMFYPLALMVFAIVPIFFDLDQITFILVQYGYGAFVCVIVLIISCKATKVKKQMYLDFVEFCKEVSRGQDKVDIIAHINQSDRLPGRRQTLYCIEVKAKDN